MRGQLRKLGAVTAIIIAVAGRRLPFLMRPMLVGAAAGTVVMVVGVGVVSAWAWELGCCWERLRRPTTAGTMDTAHMLTTMEMVPIMLLTAALMPIAAAATLGAAGFGMVMATACGGACASATDQTSISHKKGRTCRSVRRPNSFSTALRLSHEWA